MFRLTSIDFHCHTRQMHCLHADKKLLVLHMLLGSCCKYELFFMCFIRCRCFYRDAASKDPKTGEIASNFRSRCWIMDIWIFREFQSPPAHISLCNVNPGSPDECQASGFDIHLTVTARLGLLEAVWLVPKFG